MKWLLRSYLFPVRLEKILLLKLIMILSQNRDPVHWHYLHRLVLCRQQKTVTHRSLLLPVLSYCCCYRCCCCCCCYWCWKLKMLKLKAVHNNISNFGSSRISGSVVNTVSHPDLSDRYFCRGAKSISFLFKARCRSVYSFSCFTCCRIACFPVQSLYFFLSNLFPVSCACPVQ